MNQDKKNTQIKVKVCMITYNHEDYIEEAIMGVLSQDAPFDFELVIGEDCSTDKTRDICEKFASKHPEIINLLPSDTNLGMQDNFFRTLDICSDADYVAFCEGDDKWIDNNKLSYQVNYLENNDKFSAHSHNVIRRNLVTNIDGDFGKIENAVLTREDTFTTWPFHEVSLMARGRILRTIPINELPRFISGDRFLNRWLSYHGPLFYEGNKHLAIYHQHDTGASANSNYLNVRYEEIDMLYFFETMFGVDKILVNAKISAMRDIAWFWAQGYGEKKHKTLKFLGDYINLTSLKKRSDYYYVLLILFGRLFLVFHRSLKSIINSAL